VPIGAHPEGGNSRTFCPMIAPLRGTSWLRFEEKCFLLFLFLHCILEARVIEFEQFADNKMEDIRDIRRIVCIAC
jgi:hypothetical protein